jgi:two-component system, OmpR family, sensor histidine kinase KdpD
MSRVGIALLGERPRSSRTAREGATTREVVLSVVEVLLATAIATGVVAALQSDAPPAGLGAIYLLAVLAIAISRGELAALATAVLGVLTLNYLFIPPRHQFAIAHTQDVIELVVFLIAAIVVGRLAAAGRQRAAEAESRARIAAAREREATLLAEAASAILAGRSLQGQLDSIGARVADATGATRARVAVESVPSPRDSELAFRLVANARVWLYISDDATWDEREIERIAEPLGRLIDVAVERQRVAEQAAETEAARRAETARTAILHAISHDLRSPLTAITTAASALRAAAITDEERVELIDAIDGQGLRLAKLVDDLLDLGKIQADAVLPRSDWCDLSDVVASAAAHLGADHQIEFALPVDLPLVRADATQLERVFSNLLENAIKFSPDRSPVRVSGGSSPSRVTIRVTDHGRGIPTQHRAHVFEPFFRGRGDSGSGSGLGLAICRGFVEANGGRILLQAGTDGGTSFAVSFPIAHQPAPAPR